MHCNSRPQEVRQAFCDNPLRKARMRATKRIGDVQKSDPKSEHADRTAMQTKGNPIMITRSKIAGAALAASLGLALAAPASAHGWNHGQHFRQQINQLDRQVDRSRGVSNREERRLDNRVERLQAAYHRFARGGFDRREANRMQRMIDRTRQQLVAERRDGNRWRGATRW
jgi:hypothetical protein